MKTKTTKPTKEAPKPLTVATPAAPTTKVVVTAPAKPAETKVDFTFESPGAQAVQLVGSFTNWQKAPVSLKRGGNGTWKGSLSLVPGTYEYRFVVDGRWTNDPANTRRVPNGLGEENSVLVVK